MPVKQDLMKNRKFSFELVCNETANNIILKQIYHFLESKGWSYGCLDSEVVKE